MKKDKTRKKSSAYKKYRRHKILFITELIILIPLLVFGFLYVQFEKRLGNIDTVNIQSGDIQVNEEVENNAVLHGYTNIALFGVDSRDGSMDYTNTDTIIIASINNDTKVVKLVSIYRDTYLNIGEDRYGKANAAYANGGPEQAISMLNTNLDLNITDYVTVDFNAVVECVDLLGGVEMTVTDEEAVLMHGYMDEISKLTKKKSKYLPGAGTYTMDGVQACAFARIRYTAGDDYKRTERQRAVLTAMIQKAQKADLKTINSLIDEVFGDIKTSYSNTDLIALASQVFNYSLGETTGFPFEKNTITLGSKGSVVVPCDLKSNVIQLHQFLYDDTEYEPTDTVKSNSEKIISDTGFHQGDGY